VSAPTTAPPPKGVGEKNLDLAFDLFESAFEDPTVLSDVPSGATLVLRPDDDPDLFAANIEIGLAALRRGENVSFRHGLADPPAPGSQ
jgi:hypothetical protein